MSVYWLSYLSPVRDLTADATEIDRELARTDNSGELESNSSWLFRGTKGSEALILEHHH
jgi:hypothetical protein